MRYLIITLMLCTSCSLPLFIEEIHEFEVISELLEKDIDK